MRDELVKIAAIKAYITGPSGGGKSTYAKENFPEHEIVHLDDHSRFNKQDKFRPLITDWKAVGSRIDAAEKPVVLEGTSLRPSLIRKAERRIDVDPGRDVAVSRRVKRYMARHPGKKTEEEAKAVAEKLYDNLYRQHIAPAAVKYDFERVHER